MAIDRSKLKAARELLAAQRDKAPPGPIYEDLAVATDLVERVYQRVYVAQTYHIPGSNRRIEVPDEILRQMLVNGMDLWVAELLAWGRNEIRLKRRALEIAAFRAGGSTIERAYKRRSWTRKWHKHLQQLGLWPA